MVRLPLRIVPGDADETPDATESVGAYLSRVVHEKRRSVRARLAGERAVALLVADTAVITAPDALDPAARLPARDVVLGKPGNTEEAADMLARLVGRTHAVATCYALETDAGELRERVVITSVTMRAATPAEIAAYAATGEGLDKAGGYAAQGIAAFLIEHLRGSYTNVVGLPLCEVVRDLQSLGLVESVP